MYVVWRAAQICCVTGGVRNTNWVSFGLNNSSTKRRYCDSRSWSETVEPFFEFRLLHNLVELSSEIWTGCRRCTQTVLGESGGHRQAKQINANELNVVCAWRTTISPWRLRTILFCVKALYTGRCTSIISPENRQLSTFRWNITSIRRWYKYRWKVCNRRTSTNTTFQNVYCISDRDLELVYAVGTSCVPYVQRVSVVWSPSWKWALFPCNMTEQAEHRTTPGSSERGSNGTKYVV